MRKPAKRHINWGIVFFCASIIVLMLFFVTITLKIVFSPICTSDGGHVCVVETGSTLGITTAIFGMAATLFAFLGALAVAHWWGSLERRVDDRTNQRIERALNDQEATFQSQIEVHVKLFDEQIAENVQVLRSQIESEVSSLQVRIEASVENFDQQIAGNVSALNARIGENLKVFDEEMGKLQRRFQFLQKELVVAVMIFPPWEIESWAHELLEIDPASEVAVRMVGSYLHEVDGLLSDPSRPAKASTLSGRPSPDPLYYWAKALQWQERVEKQGNFSYVNIGQSHVDKRRASIQEYQKQHPSTS